MKRNRFGYFIKEGVSSIFTHRLMSFASVCIIVACLLIMGTFSLVALNVDHIIDSLEDQNQILAYVDEHLSDAEAKGLAAKLEGISNVSKVKFISRDEAYKSFTSNYDEELFEGLDSSVLRHRYVIFLRDLSLMSETQKEVLAVSGIVKVNAHLDIAQSFARLSKMVTAISVLLILVLLVVSLFIVANTIKLTTYERREEIAIMKMVGATSVFIRWPFIVEGLILGLFGSMVAYIAQWGVYSLAANSIVSSSGLSFIKIYDFSVLSIPVLIVFLVVGFLVGVFGSSLAIKNYLKV